MEENRGHQHLLADLPFVSEPEAKEQQAPQGNESGHVKPLVEISGTSPLALRQAIRIPPKSQGYNRNRKADQEPPMGV